MSGYTGFSGFNVTKENDVNSSNYDAIILVHWPEQRTSETNLYNAVTSAFKHDPTLKTDVAILPLPNLNAGRVVLAPTGQIDADYDDVRIFQDAARKGIRKALKANIKKPLLYLQEHPIFKNADLVTLLGALDALYVPIQVRELKPSNLPTIERLGVIHSDDARAEHIMKLAMALESGRIIARDIGEGDPERMAPPKVQEYVEKAFAETNINVSVISDETVIAKEYPLFEAVNRAASVVDRHKGRIVLLEYTPSSTPKKTVYLVGKGVTYDTGGADVKAGGVMAGMSRDKCGAAAVAGFMKVVSALQPPDIKIIGALSLVRNSIGSNCYVSDELIKARSGTLVRVGNTDAEGRMVMADVLCKMKELALDAVNPHLFTVATLTGHACLSVGEGYSIVMDNGPARKANFSCELQKAAEEIGDPFEVSTIRREDLAFHRGKAAGDDIMQCNNLPSSRTARGHQGPAAFLLLASGLDKHGSGHEKPIKYSHLDIAASGGSFPDPATGSPILALANTLLL